MFLLPILNQLPRVRVDARDGINDHTIGCQNLNPLSHPNPTLALQARTTGENLNYVTLASQARPSGEILNYLPSRYSDILSMIIAPWSVSGVNMI